MSDAKNLKYIKNWKLAVLALVSAVLWIFASFEIAIFWTIFLTWLILRLDSKLIIQSALILLVSVPVLISYQKILAADQAILFVYYLLTAFIIIQIVEFKIAGQQNE